MKRPNWFPRRLFAFLTGKHECADCHRWFTIYQMHEMNPDICAPCGAVRLLKGIEDAARWQIWHEAMRAAMSYAVKKREQVRRSTQ